MDQAYRWVMTNPSEPFSQVDFDPLPLGDGNVLVEVAGCGVCHTDLGYYYDGVRTNHDLPLALGHEVSGRVVAVANGDDRWVDKAVVVPAVIPCGECELCQRGRGAICRQQKMPGNDIQGGFASHIVVPAHGLCEVDERRLAETELQLADLSVMADAVTTPYQAAKRAGVGPGSLAVVNGVGGVGGYAAQICNALGATVVAIDVDQSKLDAIEEHGGAAAAFNARDTEQRDLKKQIRAFADSQGLSPFEWIVFECSGTAAGQATAFGLLTYGATLCVVGFTMDKVDLRLSNLMAFDARAIGNWGCVPELYGEALDLILDKRIQLAPFVEHHPLSAINEIFDACHAHALSRRPVLVPN